MILIMNDVGCDTKSTGQKNNNNKKTSGSIDTSNWKASIKKIINSEKKTYDMGVNICKTYTW